jgi:bifunctional non-homologous end joining protein LigD
MRKSEQPRAGSRSVSRRASQPTTGLVDLPDAKPAFIPPMKCKLVGSLPSGGDWLYELKFDGYRALAIKTGKTVKLLSRNKKDFTSSYPEIVEAVRTLPLREGVIDGEIVALDASGKPSFQALQHASAPGRAPRSICFYAFDLLNWKGKDLTSLPLTRRKQLLLQAVGNGHQCVRVGHALEGEPKAIVAEIRRRQLEGVVAKRVDSKYQPGKRSGVWVKYKCGYEQEFVIGGYTAGKGARQPFGALIVGYYEKETLRYASKVGTGFSEVQIRDLLARFEPLRQSRCPCEAIPKGGGNSWSDGLTAAELRSAVWLKPVLVCRVRFTEWTNDGHLRHPCYEGLREDRNAREVVPETAGG